MGNQQDAVSEGFVDGAVLGTVHVIAGGVETEAQREFLELHNCHAFQGYLSSKPLPLEQFEQLQARWYEGHHDNQGNL